MAHNTMMQPRLIRLYCVCFSALVLGLQFPMPPTRSRPKSHMHHHVLPLKCKYPGCTRYFQNTNGLLCHQRAKHVDSIDSSGHVAGDLGDPDSSPTPTQSHVSHSDLSDVHRVTLGTNSSPSQYDAFSDLRPWNDHQSLNARLDINSDFCSESSSPGPEHSDKHRASTVVDRAPSPNPSSFYHSLINGM
jgi:hypothetical protein